MHREGQHNPTAYEVLFGGALNLKYLFQFFSTRNEEGTYIATRALLSININLFLYIFLEIIGAYCNTAYEFPILKQFIFYLASVNLWALVQIIN